MSKMFVVSLELSGESPRHNEAKKSKYFKTRKLSSPVDVQYFRPYKIFKLNCMD